MRTPSIMTALVCLIAAAPAFAQQGKPTHRTKSGGYACLTYDLAYEAQTALVQKNYKWYEEIDGCVEPAAGLDVEVLTEAPQAFSKVHLFPPGGGRPVVMFIAPRYLERKPKETKPK
jgi:hypothetical protein